MSYKVRPRTNFANFLWLVVKADSPEAAALEFCKQCPNLVANGKFRDLEVYGEDVRYYHINATIVYSVEETKKKEDNQ